MVLALSLALSAPACGARSGLLDPAASPDAAMVCASPAPRCVRRGDDACAAPSAVSPRCERTGWRCPDGARVGSTRTPPDACVPRPAGGGVLRGSLARVPTADGRCLWIAGERIAPDGRLTRNAAFVAPTDDPCPSDLRPAAELPAEAVRVGDGDARDIVQVTGGYWLGGAWLTYRLFRADGGPLFGLSLVGSGLARWSAGGVEVTRTPDARFAPLDLGDAALVWRGDAYVYGCPGPPMFLTERCALARFDVDERGAVFVGGASPWAPLSSADRAATVFDAGPWVSSVFEGPDGTLHHVSVVGFGGALRHRRAPTPWGPWTDASDIARCALPADDPDAYCAGPVVHPELADPARPDEFWVSYGVGTTAADGDARARRRPEAYATRLVRVRLPR